MLTVGIAYHSMVSDTLSVVSSVIGWCYFACWTLTFYPQPIYNFQRKSVSGLSTEFIAYQFTGFAAYSIYAVAMFVLQQTHSGVPNAVRPNDIAFAVHALLLTLVVVAQIILYVDGTSKKAFSTVHFIILVVIYSLIAYTLVLTLTGSLDYYCLSDCPVQVTLVDSFGYVKVIVSLIKNVPQLMSNMIRQSTVGWAINGVLLDIVGGTLAFIQQGLDAYNNNDIGYITDNVPKLALSIISIVFDAIFVLQHYVLYVDRTDHAVGGGTLSDEEEDTIDYVDDLMINDNTTELSIAHH